jgi:pimeloyl-ACP methyl ester carboxylesterase
VFPGFLAAAALANTAMSPQALYSETTRRPSPLSNKMISPMSSWKTLFPFTSHWHDVDGHRLHYVDEGQGQPLLLVHGNPTWSFYWRNLILGLRDEYRVVAVDHIGCGLSDKPQDYSYQLVQHTQNLMTLVERLDLNQITLVGHDWGGPIGLGTMLAQQERFARLVLLNTGAFPPPYFPWRIRACRIPLLGRVAVQGFNLFALGALQMAVQDKERITAEVRAGLLHPYDCWSHRKAIYEFVRDIPHSSRHPTYAVLENIERKLPSLAGLPALFFWGMRDWCFRPKCLELLQTLLPTARTVRLQAAGHYVVEDAHEQILSELQAFMKQPLDDATAPGGGSVGA